MEQSRDQAREKVFEGRARVAEIVDLIGKVAHRSACRQPGGEYVRRLFDRQRRDDAPLRRAYQIDLRRRTFLMRVDVHEVEDVGLSLENGHSRLAVAVGGKAKAQTVDDIGDAEAVDAELIFGN